MRDLMITGGLYFFNLIWDLDWARPEPVCSLRGRCHRRERIEVKELRELIME